MSEEVATEEDVEQMRRELQQLRAMGQTKPGIAALQAAVELAVKEGVPLDFWVNSAAMYFIAVLTMQEVEKALDEQQTKQN